MIGYCLRLDSSAIKIGYKNQVVIILSSGEVEYHILNDLDE